MQETKNFNQKTEAEELTLQQRQTETEPKSHIKIIEAGLGISIET